MFGWLDDLLQLLVGPTWAIHWLGGVNPPARLPIAVGRVDIARGKRFSPRGCPIALAANRSLHSALPSTEGRWTTHVESDTIWLLDSLTGMMLTTYPLPHEAALFLQAFDADKPVTPLAFTGVAVELYPSNPDPL